MMNDTKHWYQSKAIWSGALTAVIGIVNIVDIQLGTDLLSHPLTAGTITLLGGLGIYGRVSATTKIKKIFNK